MKSIKELSLDILSEIAIFPSVPFHESLIQTKICEILTQYSIEYFLDVFGNILKVYLYEKSFVYSLWLVVIPNINLEIADNIIIRERYVRKLLCLHSCQGSSGFEGLDRIAKNICCWMLSILLLSVLARVDL